MIFKKLRCIGTVGLCAVSLIGCILAPQRKPYYPLTDNDRLAIIVGKSQNIRADVDGAEAVGKGMGLGALGGAGYGFAAGVTCGPFMWICSPVAMVAGLAVGGVVGGVAGAVVALPQEQARQLNQILEARVARGDLTGQLRTALIQSASAHWPIVDENPTVVITVSITQFHFSQHPKNRLQLHLAATFSILFPGEDDARRFAFCHKSGEWPADFWIQDEGANLQRQIDTTVQGMADSVVARLRYRGSEVTCI